MLGRTTPSAPIFLFLLVLYSLELQDYLVINAQDSVSYYSYYGINTLLTNVLNRYHPFVFYLSSVLLLSVVASFYKAQISEPKLNWISSLLRLAFNPTWALLTVNLTALWMGSWWALQEGTWGGWWNWDSSEMFGLLVSFIALAIHHSPWKCYLWPAMLLKLSLLTLCFLASYFFIQLNFDLVSHNFGAKFFSLFNDNFFFVEMLSVLVSGLGVATLTALRWSTSQKAFRKLPIRSPSLDQTYKLWLLMVAIGWTFWSYRPLMNYFIWNFVGLNILNSEFSLQPLNFAAALTLFIWLSKLTRSGLLVLLAIPLISVNWLFLPLLYLNTISSYSITHCTLFLLAASNLALYDLTLTQWTSFAPFEFFYADAEAYLLCQKEWVLDTSLFDSIGSWLGLDGTYFIMWNTFLNSNAPAINFFFYSSFLTLHLKTFIY